MPNDDVIHKYFSEETLLDPYAYLDYLRCNDPIHYAQDINGWVITGYDDVASAFKNPDFLSGNFERQVKNQLQGLDLHIADDFVRVRTQMMAHSDGDMHRRLRKTSNVSFGKKGLEALTPIINKAVDDIISGLPKAGEWDFAVDFSEPLSTRVIADIFDVPFSDRVHFQTCSDDVSRFFGNSVSDTEQCAIIANQGIKELEAYFIRFLKERKKTPGNDLLSLLIQANTEGFLSEEEVIAQCVLIMMAGHYTVIDQLCNSFVMFDELNLWSDLSKDHTLIPKALEESIRLDGAVLFMARTAACDIELKGKKIKKDDTVFLSMGAANRDPHIFGDPSKFDINREKSRHLGFAAGPHQCIGMGLARIEMMSAFSKLISAYPELRIKGKPKRKCESLFFRGFYSIPVLS